MDFALIQEMDNRNKVQTIEIKNDKYINVNKCEN